MGGESFPKDCKVLWSYTSRERHLTSIQTPCGSPLWSPTSGDGTPPSPVQVPSSIVPHYPVGYGQFSPYNSNYKNATVPQGPGPPQLQQAPGSYHGSQSFPSSGYSALSETHYHPSQPLTIVQRSAIEHTPVGGTNAGPYHPTGPTSTHNPVYPPGHTIPTGHSAPQDMVIHWM